MVYGTGDVTWRRSIDNGLQYRLCDMEEIDWQWSTVHKMRHGGDRLTMVYSTGDVTWRRLIDNGLQYRRCGMEEID